MSEQRDQAANYLRDLGHLIRDLALRAKEERDSAGGGAYELGRLMAYHEVISLMQNQATAFGLNLDQLSLDGIEPEHRSDLRRLKPGVLHDIRVTVYTERVLEVMA